MCNRSKLSVKKCKYRRLRKCLFLRCNLSRALMRPHARPRRQHMLPRAHDISLAQSHKHWCRCSSFDWWACKCFQRASCSLTAVSTHTVNMKLSILLALPFVPPPTPLSSPTHCCCHLSLSLSLSLSFHCGWAPVSLSCRRVKCQLSRYGNKNKTQNHLKRT